MIKVNFVDGTTLAFNLDKEEDLKQWLDWHRVKDFQDRVTAIGILHDNRYYSCPYPKKFKQVFFSAETVFTFKRGIKRKSGEKVVVHADYSKMELLVYTYDKPRPPIAARITMVKIGKQMFPGVAVNQLNREA